MKDKLIKQIMNAGFGTHDIDHRAYKSFKLEVSIEGDDVFYTWVLYAHDQYSVPCFPLRGNEVIYYKTVGGCKRSLIKHLAKYS
jgi:hypothetical protein